MFVNGSEEHVAETKQTANESWRFSSSSVEGGILFFMVAFYLILNAPFYITKNWTI